MSFRDVLSLPKIHFKRHKVFVGLMVVFFILSAVYPSDMEKDYGVSRGGHQDNLVMFVEDYGRHLNTLLPTATALLLRDWVGLQQQIAIIVVGTVASHGAKRLLNDVTIMGTRLGHRPKSPTSKHNMPSGHSVLVSAATYYMMRRYSIWFGLALLPMMFLTMYGRVMLDAHTISATIAGAVMGILIAFLWTTKRKQN